MREVPKVYKQAFACDARHVTSLHETKQKAHFISYINVFYINAFRRSGGCHFVLYFILCGRDHSAERAEATAKNILHNNI